MKNACKKYWLEGTETLYLHGFQSNLMKNTWYLIAICALFALLGISVEDVATPNQEIVIRFNDGSVSADKAADALALVKEKLNSIDANNIRIQEGVDGTLKITYFSTVDIAEIQKIFSGNDALQDATPIANGKQSQLPVPDEDYELGIYKIQDQNDLIDIEGNVVETKSEVTRFISVDSAITDSKRCEKETTRLQKVAFEVYDTNTLAIDNTSYKIPEVRAGPIA